VGVLLYYALDIVLVHLRLVLQRLTHKTTDMIERDIRYLFM
jgi:hypothetical protein